MPQARPGLVTGPSPVGVAGPSESHVEQGAAGRAQITDDRAPESRRAFLRVDLHHLPVELHCADAKRSKRRTVTLFGTRRTLNLLCRLGL